MTSITSSASTKRRGRPPKAPASSSSQISSKNLTSEIENVQDKTLKASEIDQDITTGDNNQTTTSPTNSVISVASSTASNASGRYTRHNRRTIQIDFNVNELEAPKTSMLTRSNSGRNYNLRSKDKRSSSSESQTKNVTPESNVSSNAAVQSKTKGKIKAAKLNEGHNHASQETSSLNKIDEKGNSSKFTL